MREHPIPQDITSYRFHIIGSMTLKQFGELALGVIIAVIFFKTNLLFPIKWFFILLSVGIGVAAAFVPIEERPLDHWIITFFRIMYKPTQFFWRKIPTIPAAFLYQPQSDAVLNQGPELDLAPIRRDRIKQYLQSVRVPTTQTSDTIEQADRIQNILETFKTQPVTLTTTVRAVEQKPDLSVRVRKMRTDTVQPMITAEEVMVFSAPPPTAPVRVIQTEVEYAPNIVSVAAIQTETSDTPIPTPSGLVIPEQQPTSIEPSVATSTVGSPLLTNTPNPEERAYIPTSPSTGLPDAAATASTPASFNADLPFPSTPSIPNKLVGMVLTPNTELVTDAIVEIHALDGTILRAVKTNALGQFFISTPLIDGQYTLLVEKDGLTFEPQQITLSGAIVPPIEVRSV